MSKTCGLLAVQVSLDFESYTSGLQHPFSVQDLLRVKKSFCESVSKSDMVLILSSDIGVNFSNYVKSCSPIARFCNSEFLVDCVNLVV